jgi:hypothetical protein
MKHTLTENIRPKLRLSEIERLIRKHRIIIPPPSRTMLLKMCEEGTLETAGSRPTNVGWLVYEDSFHRWVRSLDETPDTEKRKRPRA